MIRSNHYEAAFEAFLRDREVSFVAVDEAKRSTLGDALVKSLDFIIVGPESSRLVVDVKGRKFPGGTPENPRRIWQNWAEEEDISGLIRWAKHFGPDFRGVLAFVYEIVPPFSLPEDTPDQFLFRNRRYLMRAIPADEYRLEMKPRSPRWGTVHLPSAAFRDLVRPFTELLIPLSEAGLLEQSS
jgi:hypothetical protein